MTIISIDRTTQMKPKKASGTLILSSRHRLMMPPHYLNLLLAISVLVPSSSAFHPHARPAPIGSKLSRTTTNRVDFRRCKGGNLVGVSPPTNLCSSGGEEFDDFEDVDSLGSLTSTPKIPDDLSGCESRNFLLGPDVMLSRFVGSLGFDEVVDWEYFDNPGERDRNVVEPPPLDPTKPKRTKTSSGSVIRLYLAELTGTAGATLRSRGMDNRVLVKEFSGDMATDLAEAELKSVSKLQSELVLSEGAGLGEEVREGEWWRSAASRYLDRKVNGNTRKDDSNLVQFVELVQKEPYVGILGTLSLSEFDDDEDSIDANEWYRALGVSPPKPGSKFIVYEYAGLNSAATVSVPASIRRSKLPPQRGVFGMAVVQPQLPPWKQRANYVVRGVLRQALEAVATLHETGIAHRSIGRSSVVLMGPGMDKAEAASPFTVSPSRCVVKLADFGFSGMIRESSMDEGFRSRARGFGVDVREGSSSVASTGFAISEDLHALGFVFLGLLGEIFKKDMEEFREYCEAEEVWTRVVELLDEKGGAGWELIGSMCLARERASENQGDLKLLTARGLLANPLFHGTD